MVVHIPCRIFLVQHHVEIVRITNFLEKSAASIFIAFIEICFFICAMSDPLPKKVCADGRFQFSLVHPRKYHDSFLNRRRLF